MSGLSNGKVPTIEQVGQLLGLKLPKPGRRGDCPFRKHKRDKPFSVWTRKETGEEMFKCHACDPPDNVGGAIALYKRVTGLDWAQTYKDLKERGLVDDRPAEYAKPARPKPIPTYGRRIDRLELDLSQWRSWRQAGSKPVAEFAKMRHIGLNTLVRADVLAMGANAIGFTYRDPEDQQPCRVKVRMLHDKRFWVEPRRDDAGRQAYAPLYMADRLNGGKVVVITEGEVDALTLIDAGIQNVVSLPDGTESAGTVSVQPLDRYAVWLIAVDADAAGALAHRVLFRRAHKLGVACGRLLWQANGRTYKDANDAAQDGLPHDWFREQVAFAAEQTVGYEIDVGGER